MLGTVTMTRAEFEAIPLRGFFDSLPPTGETWRCWILEQLQDAHGGREWLIGKHVPPDVLSPMVGKTHTSRVIWKYVDVKG